MDAASRRSRPSATGNRALEEARDALQQSSRRHTPPPMGKSFELGSSSKVTYVICCVRRLLFRRMGDQC